LDFSMLLCASSHRVNPEHSQEATAVSARRDGATVGVAQQRW
jgi:hypothetical protein